jgi:sigma-B regulation protein RsbU (phosphoserine phosphatase)
VVTDNWKLPLTIHHSPANHSTLTSWRYYFQIMPLRYKISLLATVTVLVVLIPLSAIHIRALAQAEEEEIQGRLRAIGRLMATELFTNELGAESKARQFIFLQAAQNIDEAILFTAVYQGKGKMDIAVLNRARFPGAIEGSDSELLQQFVEQHSDPTVHYVSVSLPQNRELLLGYSIAIIEQRRQARQLQAMGWAVGLTALAVAGSMFFAQRLTRPIRELAAGMSRVARGNLNVRLKHRSRDEIGALTQGFNQMVADLQENVLERQRMSHELDIARRIQQKLLPQSEPEIAGLDVAGICLTYAEVGGDYYDYLPLNDGRLAIVIGDVFGHGISSGLLAAAVQGGLHNQVSIDPDGGKVLAAVDRIVRLSGGGRMTLCYAVLEPQNGLVIIASAGHWSPYHYVARTGAIEDVYSSTAIAPALGSFPTDEYPEHQVLLAHGDILVFYSDGILETLNPNKEMYGEERFRDALRRHAGNTAQQIRDAILEEVSRFRVGMPQEDDMVLVIVKKT